MLLLLAVLWKIYQKPTGAYECSHQETALGLIEITFKRTFDFLSIALDCLSTLAFDRFLSS